MNIFPKDIENIVLDYVLQLNYNDVMDELLSKISRCFCITDRRHSHLCDRQWLLLDDGRLIKYNEDGSFIQFGTVICVGEDDYYISTDREQTIDCAEYIKYYVSVKKKLREYVINARTL